MCEKPTVMRRGRCDRGRGRPAGTLAGVSPAVSPIESVPSLPRRPLPPKPQQRTAPVSRMAQVCASPAEIATALRPGPRSIGGAADALVMSAVEPYPRRPSAPKPQQRPCRRRGPRRCGLCRRRPRGRCARPAGRGRPPRASRRPRRPSCRRGRAARRSRSPSRRGRRRRGSRTCGSRPPRSRPRGDRRRCRPRPPRPESRCRRSWPGCRSRGARRRRPPAADGAVVEDRAGVGRARRDRLGGVAAEVHGRAEAGAGRRRCSRTRGGRWPRSPSSAPTPSSRIAQVWKSPATIARAVRPAPRLTGRRRGRQDVRLVPVPEAPGDALAPAAQRAVGQDRAGVLLAGVEVAGLVGPRDGMTPPPRRPRRSDEQDEAGRGEQQQRKPRPRGGGGDHDRGFRTTGERVRHPPSGPSGRGAPGRLGMRR